jgi:thiosulfate dehydrogenase (quinone) large subunit
MQVQQIHRTGVPLAASDARPLVVGFLALQFVIGYEWLMSGLSKVAAGDFTSGLAATLADMTKDQIGWYKSFIDGVVIPNGELFGTLVILGELGVGLALVAAALTWLARWSQMRYRNRMMLVASVVIVAALGCVMSLNFHLAMGAPAPWTLSPDPYDQGVDLDSLMVVMQLVLVATSLRYLSILRRENR